MSAKYRILWIDDKHEELDGFKLQAAQHDIVLTSFKSRIAGIAELENNYLFYDGVLLDAKFFEDEDDVSGTEDLSSLNKTRESLLQLPKKFEVFVLTGQAQLFEDQTFNAFFPKYYRKGIAEDINRLFTELKQSADKQPDFQIRHKFHRVFEVCNGTYLGENAAIELLTILKKGTSDENFSDSKVYFNPLRKIMDDLFLSFHRYGCLPDVFVQPSVSLNESSKFLSGNCEKGYQLKVPIFPKVISESVRGILTVCQPASHRADIDRFVDEVKSPYLLLSVTFKLLDVILWFKIFIDNHKDVPLNKNNVSTNVGLSTSKHEGAIDKDSSGNYHCSGIILTYKHIGDMKYELGDKIRIIKMADNTNLKTMHLYPMSALQTEKI